MVKGKEKFALWITPECKQLVDDCYADDQCQSRSEYIEKAILFYTGFLYAEKADRYLPKVLQQILSGTLDRFAERIGRQLFKLAVEQNVSNHILASDTDIDARSYKDVTGAARETMRRIVDQLETVENPPESIRQKLMELALELHTVNGKKQYGYLKKPLKDMVDSIVDELENLPEVAAYYSVWDGLRDTLESYYKNRPRQHNPLSQQKEFRAIKNAIIQEAERLRQQMEQESSQGEEPSAEETSRDASTNPTLADENTSSPTSHSVRLPSEYLLNSTIRLFHQMVQIFRENAAPPSNPMGIRIDSKRRKKLMQKRLAMGHKQDDHEQVQGYEQSL